jgi:hypothetical protein
MVETMRILNTKLEQVLRVPCLAHVIQLALKDLIIHLKIKPKNKKIITEWYEDENKRERYSDAERHEGVPWTLKKVYYEISYYTNLYTNLYRFGILLSISMLAHNEDGIRKSFKKIANVSFILFKIFLFDRILLSICL